jgi:flagellar assembly factor FliW
MQFSTSRFGIIEVDDNQIITFSEGLPGFEEARCFVFLPHPGKDGPFRWMQCVDAQNSSSALAFPVISPWRIDRQYSPTVPGPVLRELDIRDIREQAQLWAIVTVPRDRPNDATVNLLAPVLVNRESRQARQVIALSDEAALRTPLNRGGDGAAPRRPTVERAMRRPRREPVTVN